MQKQKQTKILAFALGIVALFLSSEISVNATLEPKNPEISEFKNLSSIPQAGNFVKISGKNFGTEVNDLTINLAGEDYSISNSFGNELEFQLAKEMQSGYLFIKKEVDVEGTIITLESNTIYLDLREPAITKVNAPLGLLPKNELEISGKNLDATEFWCEDAKLEIESQSQFNATIILPTDFSGCSIVAKKEGFEFDTNETLIIATPVDVSGISFSGGNFRVYGKGFTGFENSLSKLSLIFEDGSTLTNPTFVADGEIFFEKGETILPYAGGVVLGVNEISSPQFYYVAMGSFPAIVEILNLQNKNEKAVFQMNLSGSFGRTLKIMLNNKEVDIVGSEVEMDSAPAESGEAWIEMDGWKSKIFNYEFEENLNPKITEIKIDSSTRKIKIFGRNFGGSRSNFGISSNAGTFSLIDLGSNDAEARLPEEAGEKRFTLRVSNKWGSSNSVTFTLPAAVNQSFYPQPSISTLESVEGLAPGKQVQILGENLLNITSANFGGKEARVKILGLGKIETTIPITASLSGKLSVKDKSGVISGEFDYQLSSLTQLKTPAFKFPVTEATTTIIQDDEWQNLFSFAVENTKKILTFALAEFNFTGKVPLPFSGYQLVGTDGEKIEGVKIEVSQNDKKLYFREITVPVSLKKNVFTLQGKVFRQLEDGKNFSFKLLNLIEQENEKVTRQIEEKTVSVAAENLTQTFCHELSGNEWQKCRQRVRRPTGDLNRS